jgi:hypothetical protein
MRSTPFIGLLEEQGTDEPDHSGFVGKDAGHIGAPLDLAVEPLDGDGAVELGPVLAGKVHEGQHVLLGGIHQTGQLRHLGAELVGNPAPLGVSSGSISFGISGADPGQNDAALGLAGMGGGVTTEMHAVGLPGGPEHLAHRGL